MKEKKRKVRTELSFRSSFKKKSKKNAAIDKKQKQKRHRPRRKKVLRFSFFSLKKSHLRTNF